MQQIPKNTFERSFWMVWASRLLHLYPAGWQQRYGDEMLALLEEHPPTLWTLVDLLLSLCDAYLHPDLVSARPFVLIKKFYASVATILSVGLLFYLICDNIILGSGVTAPQTVFPPLTSLTAFVLRRLTSALSISLVIFGAGLLLSTGWQAFKTRRLLSFSLSLAGVLSPAIVFFLNWNDMLGWYHAALASSHFLKLLAVFLSFHTYGAFFYPFMGLCLYIPSLLISLLLVKMGGGLWRAAPQHAVPEPLLANVLLALATLCAVLLFLFCSSLIFLMVYESLSGFGEALAFMFNAWWLLVLLPVMILLTATSLARAYQVRHIFTIQTQ